MKRVLAMVFSLFTLFSVALVFGGCSASTTGKYQIWGVKLDGKEIEVSKMTEDEKELYLESEFNSGQSYVQLKKDNTFILSMTHFNNGTDGEKDKNYTIEYKVFGEYEVAGSEINLYITPKTKEDPEIYNFVKTGSKIYLKITESHYIIFKK